MILIPQGSRMFGIFYTHFEDLNASLVFLLVVCGVFWSLISLARCSQLASLLT